MKNFTLLSIFFTFVGCMEADHQLTEKGEKSVSTREPSTTNNLISSTPSDPFKQQQKQQQQAQKNPQDNNSYQITPKLVELARYNKCYNRLARVRPDSSEETILAINNSNDPDEMKRLAVDGCMALLEKADLGSSSPWQLNSSEIGGLGQSVLKTFNDLHTSWLPNLKNLQNADFHELAGPALRNTLALFADGFTHKDVLTGNRYLRGIRSVPTLSENGEIESEYTENKNPSWSKRIFNYSQYPRAASLVETTNFPSAVFQEDEELTDKVLTFKLDSYAVDSHFKFFPSLYDPSFFGTLSINEPLPSVSDLDPEIPHFFGYLPLPMSTDGNFQSLFTGGQLQGSDGYLNFTLNSNFNITLAQNHTCQPEPLERGFLKGIKYEEASCNFPSNTFKVGNTVQHMIDPNDPFDLYYHAGGGAIGGISYLLNNHEGVFLGYEIRPMTHTSNSGFARYFASNILNDFLCRDLPVLTELPPDAPEDALSVSNVEKIHPNHTFRAEGSCMECHATTDYMSSTFRNLIVAPLTRHTNKYLNAYVDVNQNGAQDSDETPLYDDHGTKFASILYNYQLTEDVPSCGAREEKYCLEKNCQSEYCTWTEHNSTHGYCSLNEDKIDVWLSCMKKDFQVLNARIEELEATGGSQAVIDELKEKVVKIKAHNGGCMAAEKQTVRASGWMGNTAPWNEASRDKIYQYNGDRRWVGKYCDKPEEERPCEKNESINEFTEVKSAGHQFRDWGVMWKFSKPYGRLIMQDIDGNHINQPVTGVEELAAQLRNTLDFSACYAKRYFHFLTGKNVLLFANVAQDPNNPMNNGEMSEAEVTNFNFVRNTGEELKNGTINLKGVIRKIIESDHFIESVFGSSGSFDIVQVQEFKSAEYVFNSLQKCASCHVNGRYNFNSGIASSNSSCEVKKDYLDAFRTQAYEVKIGDGSLIKSSSPCESILFQYLESSECGNSAPPSGKTNGGWMDTNKVGSEWSYDDTENLKKLINNDYSCDN